MVIAVSGSAFGEHRSAAVASRVSKPSRVGALVFAGALIACTRDKEGPAPAASSPAEPDTAVSAPSAAPTALERPTDALPAIDPRCAALGAANLKKLEDARPAACSRSRDEPVELLRACHVTAASMWGIELVDVGMSAATEGAAFCTLWATIALVHEANDIRTSRVLTSEASRKQKVDGGSERIVNLSIATGWGSVSIAPPAFFDFDGDGDPEVLIGAHVHTEGYEPGAFQILTFKETRNGKGKEAGAGTGKIVPYPPAARIGAISATDEDHDGRPDLITYGPYARVRAESALGTTRPQVTPFLIARSLADGSFSIPAAAALIKKHCPEKPTTLVTRSGGWVVAPTGDDIVCHRMWGATRDETSQLLRDECRSFETRPEQMNGDRTCPQWVLEAAAIEPPVHLAAH